MRPASFPPQPIVLVGGLLVGQWVFDAFRYLSCSALRPDGSTGSPLLAEDEVARPCLLSLAVLLPIVMYRHKLISTFSSLAA